MNTVSKEITRKRELTEEELKRRRKAVDFARVNSELEGFSSDKETEEMEERYARGEIDEDELDAYVDRRVREFINARC